MMFQIPESKIPILREKFCSNYPDFINFQNPGEKFLSEELNYKRNLLAGFRQSLSRDQAIDLVSRNEGLAVIQKMSTQSGNLAHFISWNKTFGKTADIASDLIKTLLEVTAKEWTGAETLAPLFDKFTQHRIKPDWGALSTALWLWRPEDYCPIKISAVRRYAKSEFEQELPQGPPSADSFAQVRSFLEAFRVIVEPWVPTDWIDIQSVTYILMTRDKSTQLAPPFNKIFKNRQQTDSVFEWMRKGTEYLGLGEHSEEDARIAVTIPKSDYPPRIVFNFGRWPVFAFFGSKKESEKFCFMCLKDRIPLHLPQNAITQMFTPSSPAPDNNIKYLQIGVPFKDFDDPKIQEAFQSSMEALRETYANWKGTSYRRHHQPEIFSAIFNSDARELLLSKGLPESEESISPLSSQDAFNISDATKDLFLSESRINNIIETLRRRLNIIIQGPPGVGKSFCAKRIAFALMEENDESRVSLIQFHQSYGYEDFIQGWRPNANGGFELQNGHFYRFCEKAREDQDRPYVLIIDEINRGNLSRIFGELMVLLEPEKRELEMALTYSPEERFSVPKNLYVLGLMNTADRSLAVVDYALRRRFAFTTLQPQFESEKFGQALISQGISKAMLEKIRSKITFLNSQIAEERAQLGPGFMIGHSFFIPSTVVTDENAWFESVINWEILPLLEEYWVDDPSKLETIEAQLRAL